MMTSSGLEYENPLQIDRPSPADFLYFPCREPLSDGLRVDEFDVVHRNEALNLVLVFRYAAGALWTW